MEYMELIYPKSKSKNNLRLINYPIPKEINEDVARAYGHIISDGHLTRPFWGDKIIYCNKQMELINDFENCFERLFGTSGNTYKGKGDNYICTIYSRIIWTYFKNFNVNWILESKDEKVKSAFLQACFDDEGSISKDGIISICQKEEGYINNIKKLLNEFGITNTTKYIIHNKKYNVNIYNLRISCKHNSLFQEEIGFVNINKKNRLNDYFSKSGEYLEHLEYDKKYNQRPEVKERKREYDKGYLQRIEVKERRRDYYRKYREKNKLIKN